MTIIDSSRSLGVKAKALTSAALVGGLIIGGVILAAGPASATEATALPDHFGNPVSGSNEVIAAATFSLKVRVFNDTDVPLTLGDAEKVDGQGTWGDRPVQTLQPHSMTTLSVSGNNLGVGLKFTYYSPSNRGLWMKATNTLFSNDTDAISSDPAYIIDRDIDSGYHPTAEFHIRSTS